MLITLEEAKQYLRVDTADDDALIENLLSTARKLCLDVARASENLLYEQEDNTRIAVLYALAYLYEHREDANHQKLMLDLRSLLFGIREAAF